MNLRMPRHEHWRATYRATRYAGHLSEAALADRFFDMIWNLYVLTPDAKIGVRNDLIGEGPTWEHFTHVIEEYSLRSLSFPRYENDRDYLSFTKHRLWDRAGGAALPTVRESVLVRYGHPEHLTALLTSGTLRLGPASSYSDPSLRPAQEDDELQFTLNPNPARVRLEVQIGDGGEYRPVPGITSMEFRTRMSRDFLVSCWSRELSRRLFVDFDAEGCVIIRDARAFVSRLRRAAAEQAPDFSLVIGPVRYLDPLLTSWADVKMPFTKRFRYAFQREYRIALIPKVSTPRLEAILLTLGGLADIADYVQLPNS